MQYLLNTNQPVKGYVFKAYLTSVSIALFLLFALEGAFDSVESLEGPEIGNSFTDFMLIVLCAPIIESLLMVPIIAISKKLVNKKSVIALASASVWALIHGLSYPIQGVLVFSTFYLLSLAYLCWEERSKGYALLVVISIHALHNFTIFLLSALES